MTEPKSVVLPLHHGSIRKLEGKNTGDGALFQMNSGRLRATGCGLLASGYGLRASGSGVEGFAEERIQLYGTRLYFRKKLFYSLFSPRFLQKLNIDLGKNKMRDFKKLEIWQFGFEIANKCFQLTEAFSKYHQWGIGIQINKSAVSIPSNVAEGNSKSSEKDKKRLMEIALGSSFELETQLLISKSRSIGDQLLTTEILEQLDREQKMLMSFINLL